MNTSRKAFGQQAEQVAERYLQRERGYRILERNVRSSLGEIDLVALHHETLVFCEVKARQGDMTINPGESIHASKQAKLVRLAHGYLQRHPRFSDHLCRFDAVLVWKTGSVWRVEVIADAFRPGW